MAVIKVKWCNDDVENFVTNACEINNNLMFLQLKNDSRRNIPLTCVKWWYNASTNGIMYPLKTFAKE